MMSDAATEMRRFLLQQMASAQSLESFYLAFTALNNFERLLHMTSQGAARGPAPGVYGPNQGQPQQPGPQVVDRHSAEPDWDERNVPW